jgi:phosphatidylserine decarboxylase
MTLHREGVASIILAILFGAIINCLSFIYFPDTTWLKIFTLVVGIGILLIILQFFRLPVFKVEQNDQVILAPADGKVVVIEEVEETEYFKDKRLQVSIFMSPFNVHVNRNPISGLIKYAKYHAGLYLVAWHPKSSTENERTTVVYQHSSGKEILIRQIAGALARRIVYYVKEDQTVTQGEEMGFIKFGSRVDLFLPLGTKVDVNLGEAVKGGITKLAGL